MSAERAQTARLDLGRTVITANALRAIADKVAGPPDPESREVVAQLEVGVYLERHRHGDWGDVVPADARANVAALKHGTRLLSIYRILGVKVYVITDATTDVCPACWAGIGTCEPDKGEWQQGQHFRTDQPERRLATTVLLPEDY